MNDTAIAGSDYTATWGTLTFAAGETEKTVSVPVIDDTQADSGERFKLRLQGLHGQTLKAGIGRRDGYPKPYAPPPCPPSRRSPEGGCQHLEVENPDQQGAQGYRPAALTRARHRERNVRVPVDIEQRDVGCEHRRRDERHLHPGRGRQGQDHQGASDVHRRRRHAGDARQRRNHDDHLGRPDGELQRDAYRARRSKQAIHLRTRVQRSAGGQLQDAARPRLHHQRRRGEEGKAQHPGEQPELDYQGPAFRMGRHRHQPAGRKCLRHHRGNLHRRQPHALELPERHRPRAPRPSRSPTRTPTRTPTRRSTSP